MANYSFIHSNGQYKNLEDGNWNDVSIELPIKDTFIVEGMADLSVLDRKPGTFTQSMTSNRPLGIGKVFSSPLNLMKYIEITSLTAK